MPPPSSGSGNWSIDRRRLEHKFGLFIKQNVDLYAEDWNVSLASEPVVFLGWPCALTFCLSISMPLVA